MNYEWAERWKSAFILENLQDNLQILCSVPSRATAFLSSRLEFLKIYTTKHLHLKRLSMHLIGNLHSNVTADPRLDSFIVQIL